MRTVPVLPLISLIVIRLTEFVNNGVTLRVTSYSYVTRLDTVSWPLGYSASH